MSSIPIRTCLINSDLKSTTKAILGALLSYCHNKDTCYPSIRDISQVWGYAESTIRKHIRILEKLEFIETTKGNKSRKSNNYKILKLSGVQKDPNAKRRPKDKPEGLLDQHTYGPASGRFDKKNPPKALSICDLDTSDGNQSQKKTAIESVAEGQSQKKTAIESVAEGQSQKKTAIESVAEGQSQKKSAIESVAEGQSQKKTAIESVAEGQSQKKTAIESVAEGQSQKKTAIESVAEGQSQKKTAIESVAEGQSQNKASVRFEGQLTTQKIVEIYNFYSRHGWIRRCYDSFFTFVANCLMIKRLRKRNVYGYLTWIYKKKFDRKLITAKDEELAKRELKLIQDNGLMPDLMEPQPPLQRDNPEAPVPPPPPAPTRSTSRPAMDWPENNLPETGKEAALAKKVEHRQLTHVHPNWLQGMGCWIVKVRKVDGKRFYEEQNLTPDGWFEVTGMSEIVPLINSESKRVSQASFIEILASGFFASDPTLPAT